MIWLLPAKMQPADHISIDVVYNFAPKRTSGGRYLNMNNRFSFYLFLWIKKFYELLNAFLLGIINTITSPLLRSNIEQVCQMHELSQNQQVLVLLSESYNRKGWKFYCIVNCIIILYTIMLNILSNLPC